MILPVWFPQRCRCLLDFGDHIGWQWYDSDLIYKIMRQIIYIQGQWESAIFVCLFNRGSNMIALILLNLLNELRERDKMRDLPIIFSRFRNDLDKFNNTGARVTDSIYHIQWKVLLITHFWREDAIFLSFTQRFNGCNCIMLQTL